MSVVSIDLIDTLKVINGFDLMIPYWCNMVLKRVVPTSGLENEFNYHN